MPYAFILIIVCLLIGLSKGGLGAGLAVLAMPLLAQVMPVSAAQSTALPLLIVADWFALWVYRSTWDMRYIWRLLPFAVIGIVVGTTLLTWLPNETLKQLVALFTLLFVVYRLVGDRLLTAQYTPRLWHAYVAGGVSGVGSALANVGGPPFTAYLLMQKLDPLPFVGTTTLFFAIVNLIKLPGLIWAGIFDLDSLLAVIWVLPILPLGVWIGRFVVKRINQRAFDRFMLGVLVIVALFLLFG
jgi:uncharacterized membrane protein YfcA